jgi:hypothetical protein
VRNPLNRRMRTRMYGGVAGGDRATVPPMPISPCREFLCKLAGLVPDFRFGFLAAIELNGPGYIHSYRAPAGANSKEKACSFSRHHGEIISGRTAWNPTTAGSLQRLTCK